MNKISQIHWLVINPAKYWYCPACVSCNTAENSFLNGKINMECYDCGENFIGYENDEI